VRAEEQEAALARRAAGDEGGETGDGAGAGGAASGAGGGAGGPGQQQGTGAGARAEWLLWIAICVCGRRGGWGGAVHVLSGGLQKQQAAAPFTTIGQQLAPTDPPTKPADDTHAQPSTTATTTGGGALAPQLRVTAGGDIEVVAEGLTVTAQQQELDTYRHVTDEVGVLRS